MFNKSNFCHIASNNRNDQKGSVFIYKTTDTLAQVTQSGYFNEKLIDINVHDLIIHVQYNPVDRTLKKSVLIVTERTMDNVATQPITDETILNDLGDLGEQVAEIEGKIPSDASSTNQLATQNDITNKITNCITEIPQDIKLELNNGTLTLKAGSTYYTPNGADTYTKTTTTTDKTLTNTNNNQWVVFVNQGGNLQVWQPGALYSGATAPSGVSYPMWWDTTNNIIKISNDSGATWVQQFSLPLCIITVSNGAISSIDEVFNGFGYMGSTEFVLPGVSVLIPSGRNADGTLNNIKYTTSQVATLTVSGNTPIHVAIRNNGTLGWWNTSATRYDVNQNFNYYNNNRQYYAVVGKFDVSNGQIQNYKPNQPFHAVDYNDTDFIAHQAMPSDRYVDLAKPTSTTNYTAPADGYVAVAVILQDGASCGLFDRYAYMGQTAFGYSANEFYRLFLPIRKGATYTIQITGIISVEFHRFVYVNGAK